MGGGLLDKSILYGEKLGTIPLYDGVMVKTGPPSYVQLCMFKVLYHGLYIPLVRVYIKQRRYNSSIMTFYLRLITPWIKSKSAK